MQLERRRIFIPLIYLYMNIKITNVLSDEERLQIRRLEEICNDVDGTSNEAYLSTEINISRSYPSFFLGYKDGSLVAFLTAFMPDKSAAELTAFVHPQYRKKKNATKLFHMAEKLYSSLNFEKLQFCIRSDSHNGLAAAKSFGSISFDRSEYTLVLKEYSSAYQPNALSLEKITPENVSQFNHSAVQCYDFSERDTLAASASSKERTAYAALYKGSPVGFFIIFHDGDKTVIHGVAVCKKLRNKGYGKLMMDLAVKEALTFGKPVSLDVDSNNGPAYHIYTLLGFAEETRTDYYNYHF